MVRSKSAKRFERLAHTVMILVTICIVLPFILLFMSSITSESALVRDGYSFFPGRFFRESGYANNADIATLILVPITVTSIVIPYALNTFAALSQINL